MQGQGSFKVVQKDVENTNATPVGKLQQLTITLKREGSSALTHRGVIGKKQFAPQLEEVLLQMHLGDKWTIKSSSDISYRVEVVEVGGEVDARSHLEVAEGLKQEGNNLIKLKDYGKATEKYQSAYSLVVNDPTPKAHELKLSLVSNLALAYLNLSEFRQAISWCTQHLEETLEPNLKVIYRKATANKGLRNWNEARRDIEFGTVNSGGDAESEQNFKKLMLVLEKEEREQEKKEKAVYGKMFG